MGADWGSAYPGQQIYYVIALTNNRPSDGSPFANLVISSVLPANLEILGAQTDPAGRDPEISGNTLAIKRDSLKPGETLIVGVRTRIKAGVATGTLIVAQSQLTYDGLQLPVRSNLVTVQVVGSPSIQAGVAQAQQTPATPTAAATDTPAPLATTVPVTATLVLATPAAAPTLTTDTAAAAPTRPAEASPILPETGAGVPIFGIALLGMTLMVRTVRVRREKERI
jgi:uncharacterized repeat protein (TIGR01451 family)